MPLPRRVSETDMGGTRVTPAAFETGTSPRRTVRRGARRAAPCRAGLRCGPQAPVQPGLPACRASSCCCLPSSILGLCLGSLALYEYYTIASSLPRSATCSSGPRSSRPRASWTATATCCTRSSTPMPGGAPTCHSSGSRPSLVAATIATEDKDFYSHPGYDLFAIARALWQNYVSGETVSGASTITQQLARSILLTPDANGPSAPTCARPARSSWRPRSRAAIRRTRSSSSI